MTANALVETWRQIIIGGTKSWVLFANGTCVVLVDPAEDLAEQATTIIREHGPVRAGEQAGDFATITLNAAPGWVVAGHHPDVLTYVSPGEVPEANDLVVGLTGRGKRDRDARELVVVHVEDNRPYRP